MKGRKETREGKSEGGKPILIILECGLVFKISLMCNFSKIRDYINQGTPVQTGFEFTIY